MSVDLTPVVTATAHWLVRAYPAPGGVLSTVLSETQARQAVTLAAWLRYPTAVDAELMGMGGPGGTTRLDGLLGTEALASRDGTDEPAAWRSWVDEVLASWATCLLAAPALARAASERAATSEHAGGLPLEFGRLTAPDARDLDATPLLRHPDLTASIANLYRAELLSLLDRDDDDDVREDASTPVG